MKMWKIPEQTCPVVEETDVLVCGGGPAGIGAAISAAKQGMRVVLIDDGGCLGGAIPKGLISFTESAIESSGDLQLIGGIWWELMDRMEEKGGAIHGHHLIDHNIYYPLDISRCEKDRQLPVFEPETFKLAAEEMIKEYEIHVLYYTLVTEAIMEDGKVTGVVVEDRSGKKVILAKRVIDATGLATVARSAGAVCEHSGGAQQGPLILFFRAGGMADVIESYKPNVSELPYGAVNFFPTTRPGEFRVEMTRAMGNGLNTDDLTKGTMECRKQIYEVIDWLKKNWPGCENMYLIQSGVSAISFSFPKIAGVRSIKAKEMFDQYIPEDVIGLCGYGIDIHSSEMGGQNYLHYFEPGHYYGIGYGCLIPESAVENLLVVGRNISCENGTEAGMVSVPVSMLTGEAAGAAAGISIKDNTTVREINVKKLQDVLRRQGVLLCPLKLPEKKARLNYYG